MTDGMPHGTAHRTLDELAEEQGVTPLTSLDELALSEPLSAEEYEEFLAAAMSARGHQRRA
ncbi:hypothetical protein [Protofrankia symbiont of Coriaria ruscifolia]|uniref:Uncharacterized protein n=1 Tax=Candidatus Protofrankia californiensis TaxID=1839754 RepID=A0A1C3PBC0_9ACTN|nr:hypothetical protein [Protofrankia symbiont of Coriaria ruscifolia]SBW27114.1 hypothetical protein FDG2_5176 [Candidatus Protofrankia californiensis]